MGQKVRRQFSGVEKVAILKRHLVERIPISDLCDEMNLNPNLFYRWQKMFFENGAQTFENRGTRVTLHKDRQVTRMKEKLVEKDAVISELVTELIKSKKKMGTSKRQMG